MPIGGVAPDLSRAPRGQLAAGAAEPQPQCSQRHKKECVFAGERPSGAHAHDCLMCTPRSARNVRDRGAHPRGAETLGRSAVDACRGPRPPGRLPDAPPPAESSTGTGPGEPDLLPGGAAVDQPRVSSPSARLFPLGKEPKGNLLPDETNRGEPGHRASMRRESESAVRSFGERPRRRSKRQLGVAARMAPEFRPLDTRAPNKLVHPRSETEPSESPYQYIEETASRGVNNGKRGDVPRVPAKR